MNITMYHFVVIALLCTLCAGQTPVYLTTYEWGTSQNDYITSAAYHTLTDVVYTAGYTYGNMAIQNLGSSDVFVSILPLAAGPMNLQWGSEFEDRATAVAYDVTRGLIHVIGWTGGAINDDNTRPFGLEDGFITTLTVQGTSAFTVNYQWGTAGSDKPVCAAVDPIITSSIYVAGTTSGSFPGYTNMGGDDGFVSIKNASNVFNSYQWGTKFSETIGGCAFDTTTGVFYIVGSTLGALPGFNNSGEYDAFATILYRNGTISQIQWGTTRTDIATGAVYNTALKALMVVGYTSGSFGDTVPQGAQDAFLSVISFNSDGSYSIKNHQWGTIGNDVPTGITTDTLYGANYVSGYTSGTFAGATSSGDTDAFLSVFSASYPELDPVTIQWGTNDTDQCVAVVTSSSSQNVYCAGWTEGVFPLASSIELVPGGTQLFASSVNKDILPVPTVAPTPAPSGDNLIASSGTITSPIFSVALLALYIFYLL